MKEEKGFTLIELIVAMGILALVAVPIFKVFLVSAKVNVKSYEKDRANIEATNKIEEIKKDPYDFIKKHETETKTRYYSDLDRGAYYYFSDFEGKDKTLDDKSLEEYIQNYLKKFPEDKHKDMKIGEYKKELSKTYDVTSFGSITFDKMIKSEVNDTETLVKYRERLSKVKCIVNKCNSTEYYDSNWKVVGEASATYKSQINVSRKVENNAMKAYEAETSHKPGEMYEVVPLVNNYLAVLTKGRDTGGTEGKDSDFYDFYIFYNYSSEDFKADLTELYKTLTPEPDDMRSFFSALTYFQNQEIIPSCYNTQYEVFKKHVKARRNGASSLKFKFEVKKGKTSIPARVDFNNDSTERLYTVEAYNMTDKPMELYILHNGINDSKVAFKVSEGDVRKAEVRTTKNIVNAVYRIDVKLIKIKEPKYELINYKTEKCVSGEEAQDFDFDRK